MNPPGGAIQWVCAWVPCNHCKRDSCECWVTKNGGARVCDECANMCLSCSGASGGGDDDEWVKGPTITIKWQAARQPDGEGAAKRCREEGGEVSGEAALYEVARQLEQQNKAIWALIKEIEKERTERTQARAAQTVLVLSDDDDDVELVKKKRQDEGKEKGQEKEVQGKGESEKGGEEMEEKDRDNGGSTSVLFTHVSPDILQ